MNQHCYELFVFQGPLWLFTVVEVDSHVYFMLYFSHNVSTKTLMLQRDFEALFNYSSYTFIYAFIYLFIIYSFSCSNKMAYIFLF